MIKILLKKTKNVLIVTQKNLRKKTFKQDFFNRDQTPSACKEAFVNNEFYYLHKKVGEFSVNLELKFHAQAEIVYCPNKTEVDFQMLTFSKQAFWQKVPRSSFAFISNFATSLVAA